jgi:hypothetical protein
VCTIVTLANLLYQQASDIPGIPPASTDDGANYLAFLVILKNLLGDKELTIAAPASYWYLKGFPIKEMALIVDYIVYMTYDLHGQVWQPPPFPYSGPRRRAKRLTARALSSGILAINGHSSAVQPATVYVQT